MAGWLDDWMMDDWMTGLLDGKKMNSRILNKEF